MEVTLNKDITTVKEGIVYSLPLRETIFSAISIVIAIEVHRLAEGMDKRALITALSCIPTAALGFVKYQGMHIEDIAVELIRSLFLNKHLIFDIENSQWKQVQSLRKKMIKEDLANDKIIKKQAKRQKRGI